MVLMSTHWKPFIFPNFQGNKQFPHFHGFHFCLEGFSYSSLLSFLCPSIQLLGGDLSQRSFLWKSLPTHQNESFSLQCYPQLCCHISALANHTGKWFCPLPSGLSLHSPPLPIYELPSGCGPILLVLAPLATRPVRVEQRCRIKVSELLCCINHVLFLL